MSRCKSMSTPMNQKEKLSKEGGSGKVEEAIYRSLIGCLMYLTSTRPDILQAVSVLSRFLHCASEEHLGAAKRVLRYVRGTVSYGVMFQKNQDFKFHGYSDSDWAGSVDDMKHLRVLFFTRFRSILLELKEARNYSSIYCRSRVHCSSCS